MRVRTLVLTLSAAFLAASVLGTQQISAAPAGTTNGVAQQGGAPGDNNAQTPSPATPPQQPAGPAPSNDASGQSPQSPASQQGTAPTPTAPAPAAAEAVPQDTTGQQGTTVTGVVTDTSGAVVPEATVSFSSGTSLKSGTTNGQGEYTLTDVAPGSYSVTISHPGFQDFTAASFTVIAGQPAKLDAVLQPTTGVTKVTVKGSKVAEVETQTSQITGTITQKQVLAIGLNGRNFTQLITLAPGVSNQTGQDEALVGVKGSVKYSVNGGRVEYNTFDVDGSDVLNAGINGSASTLIVFPSLDAISEVKVLTSNYGAIYGKSASGTVLVTTKSGGDKFHGDAYEFVRNEIWNARNFFDQTRGAPLYRRNDFGFTLGGPLFIPHLYNQAKDRTYFFFSEEIRRERSPQDFNQGVPSLEERSGNFSDVCPFAEPGLNGLPGQAVEFQRTAFPDCPAVGGASDNFNYLVGYPGNQVPMSSTAVALLNSGIFPLPNSTTGCTSSISSCYDSVVSLPTNWHEELFRIDHHISQALTANVRFIHDSWDTINATPQWGYVQDSFPTIENNFVGPGVSVVGHLTQIASPTFVNDTYLSYTTDHVSLTDFNAAGVNYQRPSNLDVGYLFNNGFGGKIPGILIGGTNAAYGGFGFATDPSFEPWKHSNPTFTIRDDATSVTGGHTVGVGVQVIAAQKNELDTGGGADSGDVQGLITFSNVSNINSNGNAFADFLTGTGIQAFQQDSGQLKYYGRYQSVEPYVQDDWKVSPRLTLNLGMRFNIFGSWHEKGDNVFNWEPQAYNPNEALGVDPQHGFLIDPTTSQPIPLRPAHLDPRVLNGLVQCGKDNTPASCGTTHLGTSVMNPAPRIGFAWDPHGDGKTSVRAGYGVFFFHGTGNEANTGSLEGSAPLVLSMTENFPFSYACIGGIGNGCGFSRLAYPLNVTAIPTRIVWPYTQQWSLSLQRQLPGAFVWSLAYVGSKGTHLVADLQLNQLPPVPAADNPFPLGAPLTTSICDTFSSASFVVGGNTIAAGSPAFLNMEAACFGLVKGRSYPNVNTLRQFAPGFGQIYSLQNVANSRYNALQMTLRRTYGRLNFSAAYTYGSATDDSSDRFDTTLVNSYNLRSNYSPSNFDQRHLLNISYVYDMPSLANIGRGLRYFYQSDSQLGRPYAPSGFAHWLLDNWELSGVTTAQTGTPFSVINGGSASNGISVLDNAGVANGIGAGSYPDIVEAIHKATIPLGGNNPKSFGPLLESPNIFAAPQGLTFGDAGRNALRNPDRINFDAALLKHIKISEFATLELRGEVFNVFNHTQFRIYNPDRGNTGSNEISCYGGPLDQAGYVGGGVNCLTGSAFLHPVDAHRPRTVQFGAKFIF